MCPTGNRKLSQISRFDSLFHTAALIFLFATALSASLRKYSFSDRDKFALLFFSFSLLSVLNVTNLKITQSTLLDRIAFNDF